MLREGLQGIDVSQDLELEKQPEDLGRELSWQDSRERGRGPAWREESLSLEGLLVCLLN